MTMPPSITTFKNACASFDINSNDNRSFCETLDALAAELGKDLELRKEMGAADVWTDIHKLWRGLVHAQLTFWDGDDSDDGGSIKEKEKQHSLNTLCVSLARFTRNLVAGVPTNQAKAFENEPDVRRLLHYYTSWSSMEDPEVSFAARILTQMLSNTITSNETLISSLWDTYLNLQEDQVVLIRLLASPDSRTLLAVMTMITSCLHDSRARTKMLTRTAIGARICIALLDDMVKLYDADEASDGARAFDVGYSIFTRVIEVGLVPDLYAKLTIQDEIVTPHQTTLLKILDSYLQSAPISSPGTKATISKTHPRLSPMLSNLFFALSSYSQSSIRKSLRPSASDISSSFSDPSSFNPPAELDVMLPKVCEALVLVTQCIVTITLASQSQHGSPRSTASTTNEDLSAYFHNVHLEGVGLVESIVEVLRSLDKFLPRINFGRPVGTPPGPGAAAAVDSTATPTQQSPASDAPGFNYLKRDLVRLLGILCNETKAVQDRVRNCGGIEVVMNLCVIDERNPYLREHSILALHNLLKDNPENQAVVEEIKPTGQWDENGVLRDTPGAVRK